MAHILSTQNTEEYYEMAIEFDRETYNKIHTDLAKFKKFCATTWVDGYSRSFKFDERDLYNNKSEAWRTYVAFTKGKRPRPHFKKKNFRRN